MDNEKKRKYVKVGNYIPADEMNGKVAVIERDFFQQGYIFKDEEAYLDKESPDKVCYIPELSDSLYTRHDFLEMCNGQEDIADFVFDAVDWQHPETYLEEQWAEELAECPACGKWFWCYGVHYCPHCGAKHEEEPEDNAWYIEKWYDEDLINALKESGATASRENIERLKSECLHIFDDKSVRNEMLVDKAREIFNSQMHRENYELPSCVSSKDTENGEK